MDGIKLKGKKKYKLIHKLKCVCMFTVTFSIALVPYCEGFYTSFGLRNQR